MSIIGAFMVPHPPIIIEEIGHRREKGIEPIIQAYHEVADLICKLQPETIVFVSPHSIRYSDYFHISSGTKAKGNFGEFGHPELMFQKDLDQNFSQALASCCRDNFFPGGTLGEQNLVLDHGIMVPLYFIEKKYSNFQLVSIGITNESLETHYRLGELIQEVAETLDKKTVVIASGDLSHKTNEASPYGFHFSGPRYDAKVMEIMSHMEFQDLFDFSDEFLKSASECGHRPFLVLAGAMNNYEATCEISQYAAPYGIGYGICAYQMIRVNKNRSFLEQISVGKQYGDSTRGAVSDAYVFLARNSLKHFLLTRKKILISQDLPEEMLLHRAGVFVSIKKNGQLRGCIGTIEPTKDSIAEEIIENAILAGLEDPRFPPVKPHELDELDFSVDILLPKEEVLSIDMLDCKVYGVIVSHGSKRGLLLPNLEGVNTVSEQLDIVFQKAGIDPEGHYRLERFKVIRHCLKGKESCYDSMQSV